MNSVGLLGVILAVLLQSVIATRPPPPVNPHHVRRSFVEHPEIISADQEPPPADANPISVATRGSCDRAGIIQATGDDLVKKVKEAEYMCINELFQLTGNDARLAFNNDDMMKIAYYFYSEAYYYDALKPASGSLLQLVVYLRAGLYVSFYHPQDTGSYDSQLFAYIEHGLKFFFARPNLDTLNDDVHYNTFSETMTLVTNAYLSLEMIDEVSDMLNKITSWSHWTLLEWGQGNVLNGIWNIFWRLTWEDNANKVLAQKLYVPESANNFMTVRGNLLGTGGEWLLRNAGLELPRFMQFSNIKSKVSAMVQKQIQKYSLTNGPGVWINMASMIDAFDKENCAIYGTCNYKETAKDTILPITRSCSITYVDQFTIVAQQISEAQIELVCRRLKAHEQHFHNRLSTGWKPVRDDNNWRLNVVIYATRDDYVSFNNALYGYDTNNGGIYIEGNPADHNNVAHFFCYVQFDGYGQWDVWNLEHEITHYFDGRYDTYGDFQTMYAYPTVWWSEGLGEYMANKDTYHSIHTVCADLKHPLSSIFQTKYEDGTEKVYYYGYASSRFMFERHRSDVDQLLVYLRDGKFDQFTSYVKNTLNTRYDAEFNQWCSCIVAGKPC